MQIRASGWVLATPPCSRTNHQPSSYLHTQLATPSADLLASALTKLGLKPWAQIPGTCGVVILGTFLGFSSRGECCQNRPAMSIQRRLRRKAAAVAAVGGAVAAIAATAMLLELNSFATADLYTDTGGAHSVCVGGAMRRSNFSAASQGQNYDASCPSSTWTRSAGQGVFALNQRQLFASSSSGYLIQGGF